MHRAGRRPRPACVLMGRWRDGAPRRTDQCTALGEFALLWWAALHHDGEGEGEGGRVSPSIVPLCAGTRRFGLDQPRGLPCL